MLAGILAPLAAQRTVRIPDPRYFSFQEWTNELVHSLSDPDIPQYVGGTWQEWASRALESNLFRERNMPEPFGDDWREWAIRVHGLVN